MPDLHVGITGTRRPLTDRQVDALAVVLLGIGADASVPLVLHHGCCQGADREAHRIARVAGLGKIEGHPGHGPDGRSPWRAEDVMGDLDVVHPSRRYYLRNRDIAAACSLLIAACLYPRTDPRSARSGTWQTVREMDCLHRPVTLVWPDGTVDEP